MYRRRYLSLLGILVALSGCQSGHFHAGTQKDPIRYAIISRGGTDEMSAIAAKSAEEAAGKAASGAGLYYRIEREAPKEETSEAQAAVITRVASTKPDGIVVALTPGEEVETALKKASEDSIPVVLLWQDAPKSGRTVVCAPNDAALGEELARQLLDVRKGMYSGKVAILSTNAKAESLEKRILGFRSHFKTTAPEVKVLPLYGDGDPAKSAAVLATAARKNPDIRGLVLLGDWLFRGDSGMSAIPELTKWTILAADASGPTRTALRRNQISRVVAPRSLEAGTAAIRSLEQIRKESKDQFSIPIDTGFDILYPDVRSLPVGEVRSGIRVFTVEQYDSKWSTWLDKGVDGDS